jgi:hypothetical protein
MGFNIAGLIIDKNLNDDLSSLEAILGEKLIFEKEVIFEEASENWKDDHYCDVYFSETGTLIFLAMERGGFEFYPKKQDAFSFVLSEMSMTFSINYVEKGVLIRSFIVAEDEVLQDEGELFDFETVEEDKSEVIYQLFEKTLGESFHEIDVEAKCYRYIFKPMNYVPDSIEKEIEDAIEVEQPIKHNSKQTEEVAEKAKPWWKFW